METKVSSSNVSFAGRYFDKQIYSYGGGTTVVGGAAYTV
jgi:hypothetical protein